MQQEQFLTSAWLCLYSLSSAKLKAQLLQEFLLYARNGLCGVARFVLTEKLWPDVKRGSVAKTSYHLVLFPWTTA